MNIFIFKSNVDCDCKLKILSNCLSKLAIITKWSVDMEDCDKVLRIESFDITICQIENHILKSGILISELPD